jgi:hypothetical protein
MDYEENQVQKIEFASPYWGARRCHFVNTKHALSLEKVAENGARAQPARLAALTFFF